MGTINLKRTLEYLEAEEIIEFDEVLYKLQKEIEWDIECQILIESGWTKVKISQDGMYIVEKWVEENIQGKYKFHRTTWFFESEKDATMFILRWS